MKKHLPPLFIFFCVSLVSLGHDRPEVQRLTYFIENKGQWPENVLFKVELATGAVYLERSAIAYQSFDFLKKNPEQRQLKSMHVYRSRFLQFNPNCSVSASGPSETFFHYFLGNDPQHWAAGVKKYEQVRYHDLYEGVDLVFYVWNGSLKYDLELAPGVDPSTILWQYDGVQPEVLEDGRLQIPLITGTNFEERPVAFLRSTKKEKEEVPISFVLQDNRLSFRCDRSVFSDTLIIDPELTFSTFTGSLDHNLSFCASYDKEGNGYVASINYGSDYPVTEGAFMETSTSNPQLGSNFHDMAISKFSADGKQLLYATYIGGNGLEHASSMVVDSSGNLVVVGMSTSSNFPTTSGAFQKYKNAVGGEAGKDLVIFKLKADGSALLASTYLGGDGDDGDNKYMRYNLNDENRADLAIDSIGNIYIAASSTSANYPLVDGQQKASSDPQSAVVSKLRADCKQLLFSTYLGGSNEDAAYGILLLHDTICVVGGTRSTDFPNTLGQIHPSSLGGVTDGFITLLHPPSQSSWSSYLGWSDYDQGFFIQQARDGNLVILGQTSSMIPIFPIGEVYSAGTTGLFLTKVDRQLKKQYWQTVVGNASTIRQIVPTGFMVDVCGSIFLAGWGGRYANTDISDMPLTNDAYKKQTDGGDYYFLVLTKDAKSLKYGSYFGADKDSIGDHGHGGVSRFDPKGVLYQNVCYCFNLGVFPTTAGAYCTKKESAADKCIAALIKMQFVELMEPDFTIAVDNGCIQEPLQFVNNSTDTQLIYTWDFGDGTSSSQKDPIHTYSKRGNYQVRMSMADTNMNCLIGALPKEKTIAVYGLPDSVLSTKVCLADSNRIYDFSYPSTAVHYRWQNAQGLFFLSADSSKVRFIDPQVSNYALELDERGCTAQYTIEYLMKANTELDFVSKLIDCEPTNFRMTSSKEYAYLVWDFGDGTQDSSTRNPVHAYPFAGTFTVKVKALDEQSDLFCEQSISKTIIVSGIPQESSVLPNVITPNGDGLNDGLVFDRLKSDCIPGKLVVYSRWGVKVFDGKAGDGWDGTLNGQLVPDGTYYYVMTLGKGIEYKGFVEVFSGAE